METASSPEKSSDRSYWVETLRRVADPVLTHLAANQLRARMPVEVPKRTHPEDRHLVTHLEACGRTLAGIAPWLELRDKLPGEAAIGDRLADAARRSLAHISDPHAPDHYNLSTQSLVDAAFLAHGCLRAPRELWEKLEAPVQGRVIEMLRIIGETKPHDSNWLLFAAMVHVFLAKVGAPFDAEAIRYALRRHEEWYRGDGTYSDGVNFAWDYYNSYVIQPFLIDVVENLPPALSEWERLREPIVARAVRYAAVQELLVAPDGSYPAMGRSIAYRCGAFQTLAQMALRGQLPDKMTPGQARCALTAVIRRTLGAPGTFDAEGWLRIGLAGHQPGLAEEYISTGSLYLCSVAFLPLGLPAAHPFWSEPAVPWTSQKIWSGQDHPADRGVPL